MSYLKKLSGFAGVAGAFFASLLLFAKYMEYDPANVKEDMSKLRWFFSSNNDKEYRQYLVLIALLLFVVAVGFVFKKLPSLTLAVSVLPMCQAMSMLYKDLFYTHEFKVNNETIKYQYGYVYIAICAFIFVASLYEAVAFDKENGKSQTVIGTALVGAFGAALSWASVTLSALAYKLNDIFITDTLTEEQAQLAADVKPFGILLLSEVPEKEKSVLMGIMIALLVCVAVGLILRRVYFINAIISFVPFIWSVFALHAVNISTSPMLVIVPAAAYFVCCATLTFKSEKE